MHKVPTFTELLTLASKHTKNLNVGFLDLYALYKQSNNGVYKNDKILVTFNPEKLYVKIDIITNKPIFLEIHYDYNYKKILYNHCWYNSIIDDMLCEISFIFNDLLLPLSKRLTNGREIYLVKYHYEKDKNFCQTTKVMRDNKLGEVYYYGKLKENFGHIDATFESINNAFESIDKIDYILNYLGKNIILDGIKFSFRNNEAHTASIIKNGSVIGKIVIGG